MTTTSHVLIIDDDENIRLAFAQCFLDEHVVMDEAASVSVAQQKLRATSYDLAIVDVSPQQESDMDLCASLRTATPAIPFIIISGYPDFLNTPRVRALGAAYALPKPLDLDRLRAAVRECLRHAGAHELTDPTITTSSHHGKTL